MTYNIFNWYYDSLILKIYIYTHIIWTNWTVRTSSTPSLNIIHNTVHCIHYYIVLKYYVFHSIFFRPRVVDGILMALWKYENDDAVVWDPGYLGRKNNRLVMHWHVHMLHYTGLPIFTITLMTWRRERFTHPLWRTKYELNRVNNVDLKRNGVMISHISKKKTGEVVQLYSRSHTNIFTDYYCYASSYKHLNNGQHIAIMEIDNIMFRRKYSVDQMVQPAS